MTLEKALELVNRAMGTQTLEKDLKYLPETAACVEAVQRVAEKYEHLGGGDKLSRQVVAATIEFTQQIESLKDRISSHNEDR
jgi:hypothetical protein